MLNTKHLLKVSMAWISVIYVVCFGGVALIPALRPFFMKYALHTTDNFGTDVLTLTTFVSGLVIWNIVALLAVGLLAALYNRIKQ